jgi:phosphoglycolate phosphatase-like HAD superfamily hydrolase
MNLDRVSGSSGRPESFAAVAGSPDMLRMLAERYRLPVRTAAEEFGVPPEQCMMVDDTEVDVRSAKAAGALAVGVLCGFGELNDFEDADLVIDSTAQLGEWL